MLSEQYQERLATVKSQLISQLQQQEREFRYTPQSQLYEGVVSFGGKADFDHVKIIDKGADEYNRLYPMIHVKGQKRLVAPNIYELRFVEDLNHEQRFI